MIELFNSLKEHSWELRRKPVHYRIQLLEKLRDCIKRNEPSITEALQKDFQKSPTETQLSEIFPVLSEIKFVLQNLEEWSRVRKVDTPLFLASAKSYIVFEPKGTVLIISPWNYPFQLAIGPLIAAISAGNNIILKPSEFTPHINTVIQKICNECFKPEEVVIVEGGADKTTELLRLPFDHIFFTGSTAVGKIVMEAAAKNLTSVTLELGGKSPCIVDETADIDLAAKKIAWGKGLNAGQTCVAPDYIFAHESIAVHLEEKIQHHFNKLYPAAAHNPDYAGIISKRHQDRLLEMIREVDPIFNLDTNSTSKMPLYTFKSPPQVSRMMNEEIFGPILPILSYSNISEVISQIQKHPKPLALYLFTESEQTELEISQQCPSGGFLVNDTLLHLTNPHLPFGGVGPSGLGSYHGYYGFKCFSHEKAIMRQGYFGKFTNLLFAPYSNWKKKLIRWMSFNL